MSSLSSATINFEPLIPNELNLKEQKVKMDTFEIENPKTNYTSIAINSYSKITEEKNQK